MWWLRVEIHLSHVQRYRFCGQLAVNKLVVTWLLFLKPQSEINVREATQNSSHLKGRLGSIVDVTNSYPCKGFQDSELYKFSLLVCDSLMHQSIPAAPIPPPGQLRGICVPCQSRGWDISKSGTARGSGICLPPGLWYTRGFRLEIQTWRILSQRNSSSSQIDQIRSSVKDWTNLWRFFRFYAFLHCLSRHNYHCRWRDRERSTWID